MASYQSEMVSPEWICSMVYILLLLILVLWRQIIGTHYTTCCSTCLFRFLLCMLDHLTCWTVGESIYTYPYVYLPAHWCALTLVQSCNTLVISRWQCLSMPLRTRNHGRLKSWTANSFAVRNFQHTCTLVIWGAAKTSFFFFARIPTSGRRAKGHLLGHTFMIHVVCHTFFFCLWCTTMLVYNTLLLLWLAGLLLFSLFFFLQKYCVKIIGSCCHSINCCTPVGSAM